MSVYWKIGSATIDALQDTHQETLEVLENLAKNFLVIQDKWAQLAQVEVGVWAKAQTEWWTSMFSLPKANACKTDNQSLATRAQIVSRESLPSATRKGENKVRQLPQTVTKSEDLAADELANGLKNISGIGPRRKQQVNMQEHFRFRQIKRGGDQDEALTEERLNEENQIFHGTGGTSEKSQSYGFSPAFLDTQTGNIYLCCHADGTPATMHLLEGLPAELVLVRSSSGRVMVAKGSLVSGFVKNKRFYTREEAVQEVMKSNGDIH